MNLTLPHDKVFDLVLSDGPSPAKLTYWRCLESHPVEDKVTHPMGQTFWDNRRPCRGAAIVACLVDTAGTSSGAKPEAP